MHSEGIYNFNFLPNITKKMQSLGIRRKELEIRMQETKKNLTKFLIRKREWCRRYTR